MTNLAKIDSDFEKVEICIVVNRMSRIKGANMKSGQEWRFAKEGRLKGVWR